VRHRLPYHPGLAQVQCDRYATNRVWDETQAKGAEGARRAKLWLESTTRVNVQCVNPHRVAVPRLTFKWHGGSTFSFDLGGVLLGEDLHGQEFLAECAPWVIAAPAVRRSSGSRSVAVMVWLPA
jgi:hypothetical protein